MHRKDGREAQNGEKNHIFPKSDGSLVHNNRKFIANYVCLERTGWNKTYIRESIADAYEK